MRKLIIGGITAALLATSAVGMASSYEKGEYRGDRMASKLGLSEEQQTQMKALWDEHREARKEMRDEMRDQRGGLRDLDPTSDSYQADVQNLIEQTQARVAERIQQRADMRVQMAEILTPEQMQQFQEMRGERGWKHDGERGHGDFKGHHGERDCR
ncbi:Spy/CpxP family protein refolding chaperone [Marinobacterium sp. YM272]|uniref:Spy/CpxP family protein refolding chaperone n=1 Tax=Marinobacterium sp. YM272 TaxID=3421654 RepID=UPI003D7F4AFB